MSSKVLILVCSRFGHICGHPIQLHWQLDMHPNMLKELPKAKTANVWSKCGDYKSVDVHHATYSPSGSPGALQTTCCLGQTNPLHMSCTIKAHPCRPGHRSQHIKLVLLAVDCLGKAA